jgi:ribosome-associated heat shock protein Hsp15
MATDQCKAGKILIQQQKAKPASTVVAGDLVQVQKSGYTFTFRVVKLIEKRVSAILAREAYEDLTPAEELKKYESWFVGKGRSELRDRGTGRPTKKDRREIESFKDDYYFSD